ncbi:hypothetical protein HYX58_03310 [Candidatus Dependentiae bacterium]|nr:hypothetical protein [Candidatus Dependentiae bacterium]
MRRIMLATLFVIVSHLNESLIFADQTVRSAETDRTLRMLDLRYKYQSFLKELRTTEQISLLGKVISAGFAAAYAPLYYYKTIEVISDRISPLEKITTALYCTAFASTLLFLAYAVNRIANEQLVLQKETILPKLKALEIMLAEEFQDDDSDNAKNLLDDIKQTIAQLA